MGSDERKGKKRKMDGSSLEYLYGFGSHLQSESIVGALPVGQNNPRQCPYGLYAEQVSGSAFTVPRAQNLSTWMYRIRPSATIGRYQPRPSRAPHVSKPSVVTPERLRWRAMDIPDPKEKRVDFVGGLHAMAGQGDPASRDGLCLYLYAINASMYQSCFCNADGDFLIVPQLGSLRIVTEMGKLDVDPGEIVIVPRGLRYLVQISGDGSAARGYACEVYDGHFELPERGPIGANGLASARDFRYPIAWFEDRCMEGDELFEVVTKFQQELFVAEYRHSPFDVVAWHGNYGPFAYDLSRFCPVTSVLFDHMDPSIFTVLTCKSNTPGVALVDFVIFPPRWMCQENTFRPPYFHRNCMTEFMGLIRGSYDAKGDEFAPGASSLHSICTPHGPDAESYEKAVADPNGDKPRKVAQNDLAFMFETNKMLKVAEWAADSPTLDRNYVDCWQQIRAKFTVGDPELEAGP